MLTGPDLLFVPFAQFYLLHGTNSRIQPCDSDLPIDAPLGRLIFLMEAGLVTAVTFKPWSVSMPHKPGRSERLVT